MGELRLILFDFDGTLMDSAGDVVKSMQGAFHDHHLAPPSPADVKSIIGLSLPIAIKALLGDAPGPVDDMVASYKRRYRGALAAGETNETLFPRVE
ncbi:MAG: HAD hydrolase-like protein, partial [Pseudomonadota bacterium]